MSDTCSDCVFWQKPIHYALLGACRRYPTHQVSKDDDWCGEFKSASQRQRAAEMDKAVAELRWPFNPQ
jgi:hypothetical protein